MWPANNTEIQLDGEAIIPFEDAGRRPDTEGLISPDIEERMVGAELMKARHSLWHFPQLCIDG